MHARMLIAQLEKAESVVKDLFLEATDDGIEALEAVLAACREEVLRRSPKLHEGGGPPTGVGGESAGGGEATRGRGHGRRGRHRRGRRTSPPAEQPGTASPFGISEPESPERDDGQPPYNEAAS
jgi:hypothetical protein